MSPAERRPVTDRRGLGQNISAAVDNIWGPALNLSAVPDRNTELVVLHYYSLWLWNKQVLKEVTQTWRSLWNQSDKHIHRVRDRLRRIAFRVLNRAVGGRQWPCCVSFVYVCLSIVYFGCSLLKEGKFALLRPILRELGTRSGGKLQRRAKTQCSNAK